MFANLAIRTRPDAALKTHGELDAPDAVSPKPLPSHRTAVSVPLSTAGQKRAQRERKFDKGFSRSSIDAEFEHYFTGTKVAEQSQWEGKPDGPRVRALEALYSALLGAGYLVRRRTLRGLAFDESQLEQEDTKMALLQRVAEQKGLSCAGVQLRWVDEAGQAHNLSRTKKRTKERTPEQWAMREMRMKLHRAMKHQADTRNRDQGYYFMNQD